MLESSSPVAVIGREVELQRTNAFLTSALEGSALMCAGTSASGRARSSSVRSQIRL